MTRRVTFECDSSDDALNIIEDVLDQYGTNGVWLVSAARHEPFMVADDDEVTASDVIAVLSKMNLSHDNTLSRMRDELVDMAEGGKHIELSVRDGVPHIDSDPTPPHGIERPAPARILRKPEWPEGYWIDRRAAKTQGSGKKVVGLEGVPCVACQAPVGELCITTSTHAAYRRGFGHSARRLDFKLQPPV